MKRWLSQWRVNEQEPTLADAIAALAVAVIVLIAVWSWTLIGWAAQ